MGQMQTSVVLPCPVETAADEWREFDFREEIGRGMGPAGVDEETPQQRWSDEEWVTFEERGDGTTLATLTVDYDDDADVSTLRADVDAELERFREYVEGR